MAITVKGVGTWAEGTGDVTAPLPTGGGAPAAGDRIFVFSAWKPFSNTAVVSGYTEIIELADGSVASSANSGSVKVGSWWKNAAGGDANPLVDYSGTQSPAAAVAIVLQKGAADTWDAPLYVTGTIAVATTWSSTSSATLVVKNGAIILELSGIRNDSVTFTRNATTALSDDGSPALTWNGNVVEPLNHHSTGTSNDLSADLIYRLVTTGASGVNLTGTGTLSASETGMNLWVHQSVTPGEEHSGSGSISQASSDAASGVKDALGLATVDQAVTMTASGVAGGGGGAIAYVAERAAYGTGSSLSAHPVPLSSPTAIAVGDHLIARVVTSNSARTVTSISDPRGNVWQIDRDDGNSSGNHYGAVASVKVATAYQAGDSITFNLASSGVAAVVIEEFSGLHATAWVDQVNSAEQATSVTTFSTGSVTTTQAVDLIYGAVVTSNSATISPTAESATPTAWTALTQLASVSTVRYVGGGYRIVAATETVDYDGTLGTARSNVAIIVAYKAAAGGGGPPALSGSGTLDQPVTMTASGVKAGGSFGTYADAVLALGPIAYWRLTEGSGTATDIGPNALHGTYNGTIGTVAGPLLNATENASDFNAGGDQVLISDSTAFDLGNAPLSIVAWVIVGTATSTLQFITHHGADSPALGWDGTTNKFWFSRAGTTRIAEDSGSISDTTLWHMLVVTRAGSSSGQTLLYKDTVDVTSFLSSTTVIDTNTSFSIGVRVANDTNWFTGAVGHVAVFNKVLSQAEIDALYVAAGYGSESHSGSGSISQASSDAATGVKGAVGTGTMVVVESDVATGAKGGVGVGSFTTTSSMPATGVKAATNVGSFSHGHTMTASGVKGAVGLATLDQPSTTVASGVKVEPELHSGTGSMSVTSGMTATGVKGGVGVGSFSHATDITGSGVKGAVGVGVINQTHSMTYAQVKAASGIGTMSQPSTMTSATTSARAGVAADSTASSTPASGAKGAVGLATTSATIGMTASGSAIESHAGAGSVSVVVGLTATGIKSSSAAATWPTTVGMTASGTALEFHAGTGAVSQAHTAVATGTKAATGTASTSAVVGMTASGSGATSTTGTGSMTVVVGMVASGVAGLAGVGSVTQGYSMTYDAAKQSFATAATSVTSSTTASGASGRAASVQTTLTAGMTATGVAGRADAGVVALTAGMTATAVHGGAGVGSMTVLVTMTTGQGKAGAATMSVSTSTDAVGVKVAAGAAIWSAVSGISGVGAKGAASGVSTTVVTGITGSGVAGHPGSATIEVGVLMSYAAAGGHAGAAATFVGVGMVASGRAGGRPRGTTSPRDVGPTNGRVRGGTDVRSVGATIGRERGTTATRS